MINDISTSLRTEPAATVDVPPEPTITPERATRKSRSKTHFLLDQLASQRPKESQPEAAYHVGIPTEVIAALDGANRWAAVPPLAHSQYVAETEFASVNSAEMDQHTPTQKSTWKKIKHAAAHPFTKGHKKKSAKEHPPVATHSDSTSSGDTETHHQKHSSNFVKRGLYKLAHPSTLFRSKPTTANPQHMPHAEENVQHKAGDWIHHRDHSGSVHPEPKLGRKHRKSVDKAVTKLVPMLADVPRPKAYARAHASSLRGSTDMVDALTTLDGLTRHVAVHFNDPDQKIAIAHLVRTLVAILSPASPTAFVPKKIAFPFTRHILIIERLAQVAGPDAQRALNTLNALTMNLFLPAADQGRRAQATFELRFGVPYAQAKLDALSTAGRLASSISGLDALISLMPSPPTVADRSSIRRLLQAAVQVELEQGKQVDINDYRHPPSRVEKKHATLAQDVLHIETALLLKIKAPADLTPADKVAVFVWKNRFHIRGPGTELAQALDRLAKVVTYIRRANLMYQRSGISIDRHNFMGSVLPFIDAKARLGTTRLKQAFGVKKSPLSPLAKFGVNGAFLQYPDEDAPILDQNAAIAIRALHKHLDRRVGDKHQCTQAIINPAMALSSDIERSAILQHWDALLATYRPLGRTLTSESIHEIANRMAKDYGVMRSETPILERKLGHWINHELTLSDLSKWAQDSGLPTLVETSTGRATRLRKEAASLYAAGASVPAALHAAAGSPDTNAAAPGSKPPSSEPPTDYMETVFGKALRKAAGIDKSVQLPTDLTPDGLHRYIRTFLEEEKFGNPVTTANGGMHGFSTGFVSIAIKQASHAFTVAHTGVPASFTPILDGTLSGGSNAFINFGSTTHGFEMFIGTQKPFSGSVAVGGEGNVGATLPVNDGAQKFVPKISASLKTKPALDTVATSGVMVRVVRPEAADGKKLDQEAARPIIVAFVDLLFHIAKTTVGKPDPEKILEKIAVQFFDSTGLSIGWQSQDASNKHLVTTGAGAAAVALSAKNTAKGASLGVAGSLAHDWSWALANKRDEKTGQNRLVRAHAGTRQQVTGVASVSAGPAAQPVGVLHENNAGKADVTAALKMPPAVGSWNYQFVDDGFSANFRMIIEKGRFSEAFTLRDLEQRDAKKFVAFMNEPQRRPQFLRIFDAAYGAGNGEKELHKFNLKVVNWAGPGQTLFVRYRMTSEARHLLQESVAIANAIYSGTKSLNDPLLQQLSNMMREKLSVEESWVPTEVFSFEGQQARNAHGINFGLILSAQDSVTTERKLNGVIAPLPIAHEWTRAKKHGQSKPETKPQQSYPLPLPPHSDVKPHSPSSPSTSTSDSPRSGSSSFHTPRSSFSSSDSEPSS